ncbi:MAG TPA: DUF2937 family protein [Methylovirgula sp.]|nr:DUF2937 family protein [Methylovirgula sp.]
MIIGRIALFFALVFGIATTQMPEFWQQYRQRLGGAIDELSAIVAQFDAQAAAQKLTEHEAVARLEANSDRLVQGQGDEMQRIIERLARLHRAAAAFDNPNVAGRWLNLFETFDPYIAERTYETFQPALPTTTEGFLAGIIGFIIGGGIVHLIGLPIRHRHKLFRRRKPEPGEPLVKV